MGNCKDCKWWSGRGSESRALIDDLWGRCELVDLVQGKPRHPHAKAYAVALTVNGYGLEDRGALETAPDFGCVQFEAAG